jgi:hypothetical protein
MDVHIKGVGVFLPLDGHLKNIGNSFVHNFSSAFDRYDLLYNNSYKSNDVNRTECLKSQCVEGGSVKTAILILSRQAGFERLCLAGEDKFMIRSHFKTEFAQALLKNKASKISRFLT